MGTQPSDAAAPGQMIVPPGHQIFIYKVSAMPGIESTQAMAWLAHLGTSSDDAEAELETILERVDALIQGSRPRILLYAGDGQLSSLMAPNNPELLVLPHGMVVWTVDAAGLAGAPGGASLVQRWLRFLYEMSTHEAPPVQLVYLHEIESSQARATAALVRGLGLAVRVPSPGLNQVLIEVTRPEPIVLSVLVGNMPGAGDPPDDSAREANVAKDRAQRDGDMTGRQRIEVEERAALEAKLAPARGTPRVGPVHRAPRLRQLLLAVANGASGARRALHEELRRREVPLQVMVDPKTREAVVRSWPGGVAAMSVYPDGSSLMATARDLGLQVGSFAGALMTPRELFEWAVGLAWAVAMNTFRAPGQPVYVMFAADEIKALASGMLPASRG